MLDRYVAYLRSVRGLSENTIRAYERDVRMYLDHLEAVGIAESAARDGTVRAFVTSLRDRGLSPRSINMELK